MNSEWRIELDGELRLDAKSLGAVAISRLDAALAVLAIAAHIPFAGRASRARFRIGTAHDADDKIAFLQAAIRRRVFHATERFVTENEPALAGRRLAEFSGNDLAIGGANP
ncbi:MAG TPA: hypothetical protein VF778_12555 [Xanthobacteraceae bacterium]